MEENKYCDSCGILISLNLFVKKNNTKSGRGNICKPCKNKIQAEYRLLMRGQTEYDAVEENGHWYKKCNICKLSLPLNMFREQDRAIKSIGGTACCECNNERRRKSSDTYINKNNRVAWQNRDPEGYAQSVYRRRLKYRFNLTPAEYDELKRNYSDEFCVLCNRPYGSKGPVIDHDHSCCSGRKSCGKCIRGFICSKCNTALGLLNDNSETLHNMIEYLG